MKSTGLKTKAALLAYIIGVSNVYAAEPATDKTLDGLVKSFIDLVNLFVPLLIGVALVVFFIGVIKYIASSGATVGKMKGREFLIWGLVALFVMMSIFGILQLLKDSLRLD